MAETLGNRPPTAEDAARLVEVEQAIKEGMQLYPAVYFTAREAVEEVTIQGWRICPATKCICCYTRCITTPAGTKRRKNSTPSDSRPQSEARLPAGAYTPFGAGPRTCIGRGMAMLEATLIVATVLQRYPLTLATGRAAPRCRPRFRIAPA